VIDYWVHVLMQNYFMEYLHGTILFINVVHVDAVVIIVIYKVRLQKQKSREIN